MQGLIEIYRFHYQVLRDELGVDPNMPNQALQPRVAASNVQNSMLQSENATDYMYDAYLRVMEDTGKKVACLLNKSVTYDSKKYREMLQKDDVKGRVFSTKVEMLPTEEERARLQSMIDNAILSNPDFIMYIDPARVMRMAKEDVKLGELYFRRAMNRMIKSKQEQASRNAQENAEAQQASIAAKAQADTSLIKTEMVESQKNEFIKGYFATLGKGGVIPPELTQLVQGIMVNIGVPLQLENQQMQQEIMAARVADGAISVDSYANSQGGRKYGSKACAWIGRRHDPLNPDKTNRAIGCLYGRPSVKDVLHEQVMLAGEYFGYPVFYEHTADDYESYFRQRGKLGYLGVYPMSLIPPDKRDNAERYKGTPITPFSLTRQMDLGILYFEHYSDNIDWIELLDNALIFDPYDRTSYDMVVSFLILLAVLADNSYAKQKAKEPLIRTYEPQKVMTA